MEINSSSKWVVNQWRQLTTSTSHVAQELGIHSAVGVQEVCKGGESSEDEEHCGRSSEVDRDRLRGLLKLSS